MININLIYYYLSNLFSTLFTVSSPYIYFSKVILLMLGFFTPITSMFYLLWFAIILDMVFGIWASWKRKQKITSSRMSNTIVKLFIYNLTLMLVYAFGRIILHGDMAAHLFMGIIILNELHSITENCDNILGTNVFKNIYEAIKNLVRKKEHEVNPYQRNDENDIIDNTDNSDKHIPPPTGKII